MWKDREIRDLDSSFHPQSGCKSSNAFFYEIIEGKHTPSCHCFAILGQIARFIRVLGSKNLSDVFVHFLAHM